MPLRDRYTFVISPTDVKDKMCTFLFKRYTKNYASNLERGVFTTIRLGISCDQYIRDMDDSFTKEELVLLNSINLAIDSYLWLANHFPEHFTDVTNALQEQQLCHALTEKALRDMTVQNKRSQKNSRRKVNKDILF